MNEPVRPIAEGIARKTTSRRGFFGRGMDLAFGALIGAAAGSALRPEGAAADQFDWGGCAFPGRPCLCQGCRPNGMCAKPCVINTTWYASGCWVTSTGTCCDCTCTGELQPPGGAVCGCGSVYHNREKICPDGTAD